MPATKVAGCLIDRADTQPPRDGECPAHSRRPHPRSRISLASREKEHPIEVGKVTYAADVAEIIQNKCQICHRPGQVGPFSLFTYDDAKKHTEMIREVVDNRRMPPWHADPRYGHFANDRSLSAKERATLMAWIDQGAPLGDARQLPPPAHVSPRDGRSASPTSCSRYPRRYHVPAQGVVSYRYYQREDQFQGRYVGPGGRGRPRRPVRRPPHHRLLDRSQGAARARRAAASDAFHGLCSR